ncbi:MAG TPA: chloride channel protein [Bryobacteraceae bacterium]|nr:chloride channel protein [Bryobacteraceae bacterium]
MSAHNTKNEHLGDFTATPRMILISIIAVGVGLVSTCVAWALLRLISLFTNLFYYGRVSTAMVSPAANHLGWLAVLVPVGGGLIIGLMARYGSERIRGHGIPEALESILLNGSKVQPRLAVLKPLSSAISIGSGGPFGAEGPIIMTGGAFGSIMAQLLKLTSAERKTLLVAGAAAGMAATFAAPVASAVLAIELLLFELKPRSAVPVLLAAATAGAGRRYILGLGPLFPTPAHQIFIGPSGLVGCVIAGLLAGLLSALLTKGVYTAEDLFQKLPFHWMWWPAIGGLFVGLGGLIFPQALGVGYDTIGALLQGDVPRGVIAGVLLVKSMIWIISLGSGTSGGVLAPLLMMGAALGGIEAMFLPALGNGFWPLVSMAAILAGTMRAPFTAIIFALELTHDINILLPLMVAGALAHATTVLLLKRSILTEKIARRGYHLSREYAIDPLEILFTREVMRTNVVALPASTTIGDLRRTLLHESSPRGQRLYPVVDPDGRLKGVITRRDLHSAIATRANSTRLEDLARTAIVAASDDPLRVVVLRMAETGFTRMPVVGNEDGRIAGMISLNDLLQGRVRNLNEERNRERILRLVRFRNSSPSQTLQSAQTER